jgi:A/G-specific adenine glycosylase
VRSVGLVCRQRPYISVASEADPYRIAVAEIMLQKTSARAVLNVYPAFIAKFPTSRHVVEDSVGRVEELLRPLGLLGRSTTIRALCEAIVRHGAEQCLPMRKALWQLEV